jgi:anti-sigma-K factor RskA
MAAAQLDVAQGMPVIMTDSTLLPKEDGLLAAEYALGVLQGDARDAFARRIAQDTILAAAVRHWDEHFVNIAEDIAPVAPPRSVEVAIEQRLFTPVNGAKTSFWDSLGFWRGLAMASLATVVALGAWNLRPQTDSASSGLVAQVASETNAVKLVAYYDAAKGELRLNRTEGAPASGRSFELWLIAGTDAPVSLGLLPADKNGAFVVPVNLRSKLKDGTLAISDEPQGGSTTGAPTGTVLATGQLTNV